MSQHFADFAENVVRAHPQRGTALGEAVFEAHNRLNAALDRRDELAVLSGLEELAAALQPFFTPPPP